MMRAWAAISASAVLAALPTAVGRVSVDAASPTPAAPVAATGDVHPLVAGNLGIVLWLSVALIGVIVAFVVLRRSRAHLVQAPGLIAHPAGAAVDGDGILVDFRPSAAAGR